MSTVSNALLIGGGALLGVLFLGVLVFAIYESSAARRQRAAFVRQRNESASHKAAAEVVEARAAFTQVVAEYEAAMAGIPQTIDVTAGAGAAGGSTGSGAALFGGGASGTAAPGITELERRKDDARARLIAAQRAWEGARPSAGPASTLELWSGSGTLRGWQFGPIGFERAFLRCEHVTDPTCWAAWEVKRLRLGFAFAAERQNLALFAAAVPIERMTEIVSRAMGGFEFALRPGFAPLRWWRRSRRLPAARRATFSLLTPSGDDFRTDDATRVTVRRAIEAELGESIDQLDNLGEVDGVLSVMASGPTLAIGAWGGRTPSAELLAASSHTSWYPASDAV